MKNRSFFERVRGGLPYFSHAPEFKILGGRSKLKTKNHIPKFSSPAPENVNKL